MAQPILSYQVNGVNPSTITTASTAVQYPLWIPGASIGAVPGSSAPVAGFLPIPGASRMNGQFMNVRAAGNAIAGVDSTSPTFKIGLYYITKSIYAAKLTDISLLCSATIAAAGLGLVSFPWRLSADMNCDTTSGILQGTYSIQADNESAATGQFQAVSGINMAADQPFAITLGFTWSQDGTKTNTTNVYQFDVQS